MSYLGHSFFRNTAKIGLVRNPKTRCARVEMPDIYGRIYPYVIKHESGFLAYVLHVQDVVVFFPTRVAYAGLGRPVLVEKPVISRPQNVMKEIRKAEGGVVEKAFITPLIFSMRHQRFF